MNTSTPTLTIATIFTIVAITGIITMVTIITIITIRKVDNILKIWMFPGMLRCLGGDMLRPPDDSLRPFARFRV